MEDEAGNSRLAGRALSFVALSIYLALAFLLLDRGLFGQSAPFYIGREADPPQSMWFFKWWLFALSRPLNPFVTDLVWAPLGINLTWTTFVPLPALVSIPLQLTVGEPTTYNIIATLALPLAAFSGFLLCRHVTRTFWPSMLGGYIFGFSPYMLGEVLGHLVLIAIFPVPLIVLVALKRLDGEISPRLFAALLAVLLIAQFLCSVELFATVTIVGGFALLVALILFDTETRARIAGLINPAIVAYVLAGAALSPYLYYMLAKDFPHSPIWPPNNFSADLLAFVVPTQTNLLGAARLATRITNTFSGDIYENGAYLGIPLIIFVELFRRRYWRTPPGKLLIIVLITLMVAALGPALHIAGHVGIVLPWALAGHLPLISIMLPIRFMMYAFLILAVMTAIWFADSDVAGSAKFAAATLILISLAPNPRASFWVSPLDLPPFFADGTYAKELTPREIILPLPFSVKGSCMYWQLHSDMYFRMAGAWTGVMPFEFQRMPLVNYFYGAIDLPEAADQLKTYLARFEVQAVVADPSDENFQLWRQTLASLGVTPSIQKGVSIYNIPAGSLAAYASLPAASVEARANALRFDSILGSAAKYVADGHPLSKLSALELKRLDLLPRDWIVDADPHAYIDWQIGPLAGGRIAIIIVGSYEGVKPLIERYRESSTEIAYPAPMRWTPESTPRTDVVKPLAVIFDSAQLVEAAYKLRLSPPSERTTSFLAGVSGSR